MAGEAFWLPIAVDELGDLDDVDTTSTPPVDGDLLQFDGSVWVPVGLSDVLGGAGRWEVLLDESEQPVSDGAGDWLYILIPGD